MRKNKTNPVRPLIKCGFLLCLFLTITPCQLHAQDIDFTAGCPNGAYTFSDVTIGSSISPALTINAVNTPGGAAATMSIQYVAFDNGLAEIPDCIIPPCSSPYAIYGVNITTSGGTVTVDGTPDNAAVGFTIIFTIRATAGGSNCDRTFHLPIVRKPLEIVLVLDRSGSMECPPGEYNWFDCVAPNFNADSRWAKLKNAINMVATKLNENAISGDQMSMILFDGAVKTTASAGVDATMLTGFVATDAVDFESDVSDILDDQVQPLGRNGTAIGTALKGAVNRLPVDDTKLRVFMLFTDGEQNVTPYVRDFAPDLGKYVEDGGPFFLNNGTEPNTIEKFTVGFGTLPSAYNTLLENIASISTNYFSTTSGSDGTFQSLLINDFVNQVFVHSSPQNVVERTGDLQGGFSESVTMNKDISKIYLESILDSYTRNFSFSVWHDGSNIIPLASKMRILNSSIIFIFDRHKLDSAEIPIEGRWELRATPLSRTSFSSDAGYTFSATADDHLLDMEFNPGASRFKVGDVVNPSVKLTYKRDPLLNSKVSALLIGPGDDLADKIARDEVKYFDPSSDPNKGTLYTQKLSKLLENDPLYLKKFADQNQKNTIDLTDPGNEGIYSGDFGSAVAMTGVYHLIYFIEHYDGGDTIIRQKRLTLLVNPDDIDLDASELSVEQGEGNRTLLTINPTDTRGRRLGLGLNFHLVANNAQIESILPHLDGSYTLKITGELKGNGELTVLDIPVFKGNLQKLTCYSGNTNFFQKIQCWIWSLGLPMWIFWLILIIIIILIWIILRRRP